MPLIQLQIPETHVAITRPVVLNVVRDLDRAMRLGIAENDITIQYLGRSSAKWHLNSTTGPTDTATQGDQFKTDATRKISISVTEDFDETTLLTTKSFGGNTSPNIFNDPNLSITMRPKYSSTKVTIDVSYRTEDLRAAEAWGNEIRSMIGRDRAEMFHESEYTYPIPLEYIAILHELYKTRESQAGYGDTFKEYFDKYRSDKFTRIVTMKGSEPILAIQEKALNILGWFNFSEVPKEERGDHHPNYVISFQYVFMYDKPIQVVMTYPLAIHNQLIPKKLRDSESDTNYADMIADRSLTTMWMDRMRELNHFYRGAIPGIRIPHFDEWWSNSNPLHTVPAITMLCGVDPDDLTNVNSIVDYEYFLVSNTLIPYFTKYRTRLLEPGFSPFVFRLYCGDKVVDPINYFIDDQLILRTHVPMNLRLTYHFRFSILIDLSLLSQDGKNALGEFPELAQEIIDFVTPGEVLETILDGGMVKGPSWDAIVDKYFPLDIKSRNHKFMYRNVGYFLVVAH